MTKKHLLVEGWRGVNHSIALVNQHQLLELVRRPSLRLSHRDRPFAISTWNRQANASGFLPEDMARIDAIPEPGNERPDVVLSLSSPIAPVRHDGVRQLTFMVTELGLGAKSFEGGEPDRAAYTAGGNRIVTPTNWSRDRLVDFGFDAQGIEVISHGVRMATFHPLSREERASNRANLGLRDDEFVFLNLGVATWNKGLDLLLIGFARARQRHQHLRLILKDQRDLYGVSIEPVIKDVVQRHPALFTEGVLNAIMVVPGNLNPAELRLLYGVADCYASPYRGEGFNLPVLEAIACGTPVVVTDGGATDDFVSDEVAIRVASRAGEQVDGEGRVFGRYREVDGEAFVQALLSHVDGWRSARPRLQDHCMDLAQRFSWARAVDRLETLICRDD